MQVAEFQTELDGFGICGIEAFGDNLEAAADTKSRIRLAVREIH